MIAQDIISNFNTYTDDMSQLSAAQEYSLLNKKYREVCNWREWEFLRTAASVTIASNEIALPSDFKILAEDFTDHGHRGGSRFMFWVGNIPYSIINMKDRRTHTTLSYIDVAGKKIVCQDLNISGDAEFDYLKRVTALTVDTSPIFDADFHEVLYHMMAIDHEIIDQSEKARSMRGEHNSAIKTYKEDMTYQYSQFEEDFVE